MRDDMRFLDPGRLVDGELELALAERLPANPEKGFLPAYKFDMRRVGDSTKVGEIGLKIGTPPNHLGHIWYRVFPDYRGNHYAARSCRLLTPLARRHGIDSLWITCREENVASRRTCELVGAEFVGMAETPEGYRDWLGPVRLKCKYRLDTSERNG
jgi:RimJ/RimL family protein N-acetyltransferase